MCDLNRREYLQTLATPATLYGAGLHKGALIRRVWAKPISSAASAAQYLMVGPGREHLHRTRHFRFATAKSATDVADFDPAKDVIDLSHIDANLTAAGVQKFTFIGTAPFSGAGAQVRYQQDPANNVTYVEAELAGDSSPDLSIRSRGLQTLTAANFALTAAQSKSRPGGRRGSARTKIPPPAASATEYSYTNVTAGTTRRIEAIYRPAGLRPMTSI